MLNFEPGVSGTLTNTAVTPSDTLATTYSSGLKLRDYQAVDIVRAVQATLPSSPGRIILGHEMGLGKTAIALHVLQALLHPQEGSVLVIGPKVTLGIWEAEIVRWLGKEAGVTIWVGTPAQRERLWSQRKQFVVTNYALVDQVLMRQVRWGAIVLDEAHTIRNRKTKTFQIVRRLQSSYLLLLTGTPVVNNPANLWTLLNLLDPKRWSSYWRFVTTYCHVVHNGFGQQVLGPKNPQVLRTALAPYLIRRRKEEVLLELPPKIRQVVPVLMTPAQQKLYDLMAHDLEVELVGGETIRAPSVLAKITRLRQISISPLLLGQPEQGAAMKAVLEQLELEIEAGNAVLIYSPFVSALTLLRPQVEKLTDATFMVVGGLSASSVAAQVAGFQAESGRKALLATVTLGLGWSATAANVALFLGYDWTPAINLQAEDRLHRVGQTNSVRALYFASKGTIDQHILNVLSRKTTWATLSLEPEKLLRPSN